MGQAVWDGYRLLKRLYLGAIFRWVKHVTDLALDSMDPLTRWDLEADPMAPHIMMADVTLVWTSTLGVTITDTDHTQRFRFLIT